MEKFYYFLVDQPDYPNPIMANNKEHVRQILMETLADESSIGTILTEEEFNNGASENNKIIDDIEEPISKNFINEARNAVFSHSEQTQCETVNVQGPPPKAVAAEVKYFEEAGIQFKLENGKLFKKTWKDVSSDENSEFRILKTDTNKVVDSSKFKLEKLDWVEIG